MCDKRKKRPRSLYHYTINTRHGNFSPRSEVSDATIELLKPIVESGSGVIPRCDWHVKIAGSEHGAIFTVLTQEPLSEVMAEITMLPDAPEDLLPTEIPLVTCGLAISKVGLREVMPHVWELNRTLRRECIKRFGPKGGLLVPPPPDEIPQEWPLLAVFLHPFITDPQTALLLGDCERCMAWAIMEIAFQEE